MKIYYKIPDSVSDIETEVEKAFLHFPDEYKEPGETIKKLVSMLYNEKLYWFYETIKYKIKWAVRSLEQEIESENGMIVINDQGGADVEGFSDALTDKIVETITDNFER
jgi:hypothetical protein